MVANKPCKYLNTNPAFPFKGVEKQWIDEHYMSIVACKVNNFCPKQKLKGKITPHCWRIG